MSSVFPFFGLDLISTRIDLPMDQDDARVAWVASLDVVDLDARRHFGRIMLEAHDDEMFYCGCQLYARAILGVWSGCCDHEYKLRPLTCPYLQLEVEVEVQTSSKRLRNPQRDSRVARRGRRNGE